MTTELKTNQDVITGLNLGALFHGAQGLERNNGYLSKKNVDKLRFAVPEFLHQYCRMTGTQSNNMALRFAGYNDPVFAKQLDNQRVPQPSISYWHAFVDFYHKWGFKGAAITLNVNTSFENWDFFESDIVETLAFLERNGVNLIQLELGNELYYYPQYVAGLTAGSPNVFDRARLGITNANVERNIATTVRALGTHLKRVYTELELRGYNQPKGIPVHSPIAMRERIFTTTILQEALYDFVVPHIYTIDATPNGVDTIVARETQYLPKGLDIRVTEFNFNYQARREGHTLTDQQLYDLFKKSFQLRGINTYFFHCLWNRSDANGWAKGVL